MGEPNYVNVSIQTEGVVPTAARAVGKVAIVGYSTATANVVAEHSSVSQINSTYGATSALARSAALAIQNGANPVFCVPVGASVTTYDVGSAEALVTASGSDVTSALSYTLTNVPVLGTIILKNDTTALVEGPDPNAGHDYLVDVGNKQIILHNAVTVLDGTTLNVSYLSHAESDFATALTNLESFDANFVVMAYGFGDSINGSSSSLETHVVSAASGDKPRMGIVMNAKGIASTTLAGTLTNDRIALFHHNSYYDVAAIVAGVLSTLQPQESLLLKPVAGDVSTGNFTDAQYVTFRSNQINALVKHSRIPTPSYRITESFTLSNNAFKKYIDSMRVIDDSAFKMKAALTNPGLLGTVKLGTIAGMNTLRAIVNKTLRAMVSSGEIDSYSFEIPGEEIVRKAVSERTAEEVSRLADYIATRQFSVLISIVYTGAVHTLDPVKITYSGT